MARDLRYLALQEMGVVLGTISPSSLAKAAGINRIRGDIFLSDDKIRIHTCQSVLLQKISSLQHSSCFSSLNLCRGEWVILSPNEW